MSDSAYVVHSSAGRTRIKVPARKGNVSYFDDLEALFGQLPDVKEVSCNPAVASVLILHDTMSIGDLQAFAAQHGLFELEADPRGEALWELAAAGLSSLDRKFRAYTDGNLDVRSMLLLVMMFLLVRQLLRGHVAAPAASLLWYVFQMLTAMKR